MSSTSDQRREPVHTASEEESRRIAVHVVTQDPLAAIGIETILANHPSITRQVTENPDVALVVEDTFVPPAVTAVQETARLGVPIVLLATTLAEDSLLTFIEHGVVCLLDRRAITENDLTDAILSAAHGRGVMSGEMLGKLLGQVRDLQRNVLAPLGYTGAGLSDREVEILRLLAEGADTAEIAKTLAYSESTVKKVLYMLTGRLKLRNRIQAVAFAVRAGVL